jgi:sugar phosphate isomerase/epimerase
MYLTFNANTLGLGKVPLAEQARLAAASGFEGIDLPPSHAQSLESIAEAAELCRAHGLRAGAFPLPCNVDAEEEAFELAVSYLHQMGPTLYEAGFNRTTQYVLPGSNERPFEENMAWLAGRIRRLHQAAQPAGIKYGFEFIGPKTLQAKFTYPFIDDLDGARQLIEAAGGGMGVLFDAFHWYTSGGTLETLARALDGVPVVYVHVNDARADRSREEQLDGERAMPLETGVIDTPAMLKVLGENGFNGPVAAEPFQPAAGTYGGMDPARAIAEAGKILTTMMERARA